MTVTELLESVRRVEVRTNRLVNDTMGDKPQLALTPLVQNGKRKT
jgi:hypothetical protein